jgi:hypothetical protein
MPANALYYGDNLSVLRSSIADESIDLIYLDPPFNSNASYNVLFKAMFLIIAWISLSFTAATTASAEKSTTDEANQREQQQFYVQIEQNMRQEFETYVAQAVQSARERNPSISSQQVDSLIDGLKGLFYNKVNIYVSCAGDVFRSPEKATDADTVKYCIQERIHEMQITLKVSQYADSFTREEMIRCEMKARLFERELLLRGGPGCLNRFSASISGASARVRLPSGVAAG